MIFRKEEFVSYACKLFFLFLVASIIGACTPSQKTFDDAYFKQYILEDQGAEPSDTSFTFNSYETDLTGDSIIDPIYITTYMDNYFGYVFNGHTGEEVPQSGWVNFISKPGREMHLEFKDLTCDKGMEIIQYSIAGQFNNDVHFDVLSFQNDSLVNVFSKVLTRGKDQNGDFSIYSSLLPIKNCGSIKFQSNAVVSNDSISNKIQYILDTEVRDFNLMPFTKPTLTFQYDSISRKFIIRQF